MPTTMVLTEDAFERRVQATPDLELSWVYWHGLLPLTTGRAIWALFLAPALREIAATNDAC